MNLKVIVTRAPPGAGETAARLAAAGYDPIVSPMLEIVPVSMQAIDLGDTTDIVFTSANGVRAFAGLGLSPATRTAWCVGPSTAEAARKARFASVIEGAGNAEDLAALILDRRQHLRGPLVHIANTAAAGELVARLVAGGLDARFAAPYETRPVETLSPDAIAALESDAPVCVMVHSAKAAEALRHTSTERLAHAAIVAISAAAAAPLRDALLGRVTLAASPNEDAMFAALPIALGGKTS